MLEALTLSPDRRPLISAFLRCRNVGAKALPGRYKRAKSREFFVLLLGPPGVGKSMAAEAISSQLQRPLLAGRPADLGSDIHTFRPRFLTYIMAAQNWAGVVLVENADALASRRTTKGELERSQMIAFMVQRLETFTSLFILTTNQTDALDPALLSRVNMAI